MLVIISDLHLTDGTTGSTIPASAFRLFRERLESMVYDASKRADGKYRPIERIDLVLLGDVLDLIRSTAWTDEEMGTPGHVRPWDNPNTPAYTKKIDAITQGILQNNREASAVLRSLADGSGITLPPATRYGQVDRRVSRDRRSKSRLPVEVKIHYMIGNHDWFYHLPGKPYDAIRRAVRNAFGLENPESPFPHSPTDSAVIERVLRGHEVFARHGDVFDATNYVEAQGRDYSSVGDAYVIDLFNPFPVRVKEALGAKIPAGFYEDLNEMGNIRPSLMTPVWITSVLNRHQIDENSLADVDQIWDELVDRFLNQPILRELDKPFKFDLIDKLELAFRLSKPLTLKKLSRLAPRVDRLADIYKSLSGGSVLSFEERAANEPAFVNAEARFIVYGHTHGYKVHPLRSAEKNGRRFDQLYINSGTWKSLHELGHKDPERRGFVSFKTMTYLAFYKGDERKGRSFETWTGTLEV